MLLCDLDLTFDLAKVTLTSKILLWLYLRNHKVTLRCRKLIIVKGHWLGDVCGQCRGVTLI